MNKAEVIGPAAQGFGEESSLGGLVARAQHRVAPLAQRAPGNGPLHQWRARPQENKPRRSAPVPTSQSETGASGKQGNKMIQYQQPRTDPLSAIVFLAGQSGRGEASCWHGSSNQETTMTLKWIAG